MLLTYRNCRLGLYEIIERHADYEQEQDPADQLRRFISALAAALALYARSLTFVRLYEDVPLVRKKLNEPDDKLGLDRGFFDEVLMAFTSLQNYQNLMSALRFWRDHRRAVRDAGLETDPTWGPLCDVIRRQYTVVRKDFGEVARHRLRTSWASLWKSAMKPLNKARYGALSGIVNAVGGIRRTRDYRPAIDGEVISQLRESLGPGDVLVMRCEERLSSTLLPGFWGHAALFAGARLFQTARQERGSC